MKKLMIAAASAAMIGGAFADGQVYEMTLNVKTTEAKSGTVNVQDGCYTSQSYRKQTSVKIAGLFWGCSCSTLAETGDLAQDKGVFFWNASKKAAFYDQDAEEYIQPVFEWKLLNRIGQKAADCEGVWELTYGDAYLYGAGFGKVTGYEDAAYVKSMSGNFAGTMNPGNACKRCEEINADAWPLCECGDQDDDLTAAYGSWSLKFNSSAAKKFADSTDWSWYKFPGDVLEAIQAIIAGQDPDPEVEDKVTENYKKASAAYTTATETQTTAYTEWATLNEAMNGTMGEQTINATTGAKFYSDYSKTEEALADYKNDLELYDNGTLPAYGSPYYDQNRKVWRTSTLQEMLAVISQAFTDEVNDEIAFEVTATAAAARQQFDTAVANFAAKKIAILPLQATVQDETTGLKNGIVGYTRATKKAAEDALDDARDDFQDATTNLIKVISDIGVTTFSTKEQKDFNTIKAKFLKNVNEFTEVQMAYDVAEDAAVDDVYAQYYLAEKSEDAGYAIYDEKAMTAKLEELNDARTAANTAWTTARNDLQTAETACLVTKGSKDCQ